MKNRIGFAMSAIVISILCHSSAWGQGTQTPAAEKPAMSEQYFKNIQVLRGIPVDEFMDTMGMFAAATGMNCVECHIPEAGGSWARYADDNDYKRTTRMMVLMVNALNQTSFGGNRKVTCYTCHRGLKNPAVIPNLDVQYGDPPPLDPDLITQDAIGAPSVDKILEKYIQALGGPQRVAGVTSIVGKGTYRAYDDFELSPLEYYAKAPNQSSTIQHTPNGDLTITSDGQNAWMAAPSDLRPYPLVTFTGGDRDGAGIDAILAFPGRIKQAFTVWRAGPLSTIDNQDVQIVQASMASGYTLKLYFDVKTGLLLRSVRYVETPVGKVPVRVDYSDYRTVSGVKIPFKWVSTWTDGRTVFQLNTVQVNVPVDAGKFAKPAPPKPATAATR
jgi:photosynthetic reaction center cytochrome c subunit